MSSHEKTRVSAFLRACALCCLAAVLVASCATSKGSTLGTVIAAEGGTADRTPPVMPPSQQAPTEGKGLQVVTDPVSAEVWIDGTFMGLSPYTAVNLDQGWHKLTLRKQGYYELSAWVEFTGTAMVYQTALQQITGFLQVSTTPADSMVIVNGQPDFQRACRAPRRHL